MLRHGPSLESVMSTETDKLCSGSCRIVMKCTDSRCNELTLGYILVAHGVVALGSGCVGLVCPTLQPVLGFVQSKSI